MSKKVLALVLAAAMAALSLTACGGASSAPASSQAPASSTVDSAAPAAKPFEGQTLSISTFSFNAELLQKNIYDPFMEATGAKLVVDTGKNAERVTKIKETPANYDVVVIGDLFVSQLAEAGLIDTMDRTAMTNLDAL